MTEPFGGPAVPYAPDPMERPGPEGAPFAPLLTTGRLRKRLDVDEIGDALRDTRDLDRFLRRLDDLRIRVVFPEEVQSDIPVPHDVQLRLARRIDVARARVRVALFDTPVGAEQALQVLDDVKARKVRLLLEDARAAHARLRTGKVGKWNALALRHTVRERAQRWRRLLEGAPISTRGMRAALERIENDPAGMLDRPSDARHRLEDLRSRFADFSRAQADLAARNVRLVFKLAGRYRNAGLSREDLIQEGHVGLMEAVDRFDAGRGFRFSTYARWWIRRTIEEGLASQVHPVRLPVHVSQRLRRWNLAARSLRQRLEREPDSGEIVREGNVPAADAAHLRPLSGTVVSLHAEIHGDPRCRVMDRLSDSDDHPESAGDADRMLRTLPFREQTILRLRYGIGVPAPCDRNHIAGIFRVTSERIRQIEDTAIRRLQSTPPARLHN